MKRAVFMIILIALVILPLPPQLFSPEHNKEPKNLIIQQYSRNYQILAGGEGLFNGSEGTYRVPGEYTLNVTDTKVTWCGEMPMWADLSFSIRTDPEDEGLYNSTIRSGIALLAINRYSRDLAYSLFEGDGQYCSMVSASAYGLSDPSGDGDVVMAYTTINCTGGHAGFVGDFLHYTSYDDVLTKCVFPANTTVYLANGTTKTYSSSTAWCIVPGVLYAFPDEIVLTIVVNFTGMYAWWVQNTTFEIDLYGYQFKLFSLFPNGTLYFYVPPTAKYFNFTWLGDWIRLDVELISLLETQVPDIRETIRRAERELVNIFSSVFLYFYGVNMTRGVFFDAFGGVVRGKFVYVPQTDVLVQYAPLLHTIWVNDIVAGITHGINEFTINVGIGFDKEVFKEAFFVLTGERVTDVTWQADPSAIAWEHNHTIWWYVYHNSTSMRVTFYYHLSSEIERTLEERAYYLHDSITLSANLPFRIEEIRATGVDAIVTVDGERHVTSLLTGTGGVRSALATRHEIDVCVYPRVEVEIKVVDARGMPIEKASLKLVNRDTGRVYYAMTSSPAELNISSGIYDATVRVLIHEEELEARVTLKGGVVELKLSVDMREIAGETLRMLLLYVPVALVIPLAMMFASAPFLVKRKKK